MKIKIKKIGSTAFGNWCTFDAVISDSYIISGIASYDPDIMELTEDKVYNDIIIHQRQRNGRTYYKFIRS